MSTMTPKFSTNIYKINDTWIPKTRQKALLPPLLKLRLRSLLFSIILLRTINEDISKKFHPQVCLVSNLLKRDKFCINCL